MADPADTGGGDSRNQGDQGGSVEPEGDEAEQHGQQPTFQPADQQQIAEQSVDHAGETVAGRGPEQHDRHLHQQHGDPDRDVVPQPPGEHKPAQRQEHGAVRHQVGEPGVAERGAEQSPPGQARTHGQVPLPGEQDLIDQFLAPGHSEQQQRQQKALTHPMRAAVSMMARRRHNLPPHESPA